MIETSIPIQTENFDGPLGLLLVLIQKEQMSIKELDINLITKQYLDYIQQMREINFDVAGDYLYLAATLLLLKSKSCLSEEEVQGLLQDHPDAEGLGIKSRSELIRRLEELQRFQALGEKLWGLPKRGHEIFVKPKINRKAIIDSFLTPVELDRLVEAMVDFLFKESRKYKIVRRDRISIKEKLQHLKNSLSVGQQARFSELLEVGESRRIDDIIITFISLLELARLKKISIFQNDDLGEIYLDVIASLQDFNVELADGFEPEETEGVSMDEAPAMLMQ